MQPAGCRGPSGEDVRTSENTSRSMDHGVQFLVGGPEHRPRGRSVAPHDAVDGRRTSLIRDPLTPAASELPGRCPCPAWGLAERSIGLRSVIDLLGGGQKASWRATTIPFASDGCLVVGDTGGDVVLYDDDPLHRAHDHGS